MLFALATSLLVGLDLYLSYRRIREYGALVELNPVARQLAQDYGPFAGTLFLGAWNIGLIAAALMASSPVYLHVLFGAKLGLASMQLKSLQIEHYIDKILRKVNEQKKPHSS